MGQKSAAAERNYDFSDGVLLGLANTVASTVTRDLVELAERGVTEQTVINLNALREAVKNAPDDIEARGVISDMVEVKEAARNAVLVKARSLRTAAQNVFWNDQATYDSFGFRNMDKIADYKLPAALWGMHRTGTAQQAALAGEGISEAFLDAFAALIGTYATDLENVKKAEQERDNLTQSRSTKGNTLYREIVRLCNIGKDVFREVSEARYNDYVIENFVGRGKRKAAPPADNA